MWRSSRTKLAVRIAVTLALGGVLSACGLTSPRHSRLATGWEQSRQPVLVPGDDGGALFEGATVLDPAELVRTVLERNPTIERARQGWRAATAKYPQAVALADPWVTYTFAPLSIFSDDVKYGQGVQVSQALPYFGKRKLRGEVALAEAEAKREDFRVVRQRLGLIASLVYYDYYLVEHALEINREHTELLAEDREVIAIRMEAGTAWLEDATQIDVDVVNLRQQRLSLEADRDIIVAQLNELMHRRADLPLPRPRVDVDAPAAVGESRADLVEEALARRPEFRAARVRVGGAASAVSLADRDFYPDFRVIGTYNGMWPMVEHQLMFGIGVELPLQRRTRHAAVDEAESKLAGRKAETDELRDQIGFEVEKALRRTQEADEIVATYRDELLPASRDLVTANRAGLDTGRTSFVEVVRAERNVKTLELRYHAAIADAYRRRAELERAVGRIPGLPRDGGEQ